MEYAPSVLSIETSSQRRSTGECPTPATATLPRCSQTPSPSLSRRHRYPSDAAMAPPFLYAPVRFRSRDVLRASGMRRSTLLELSGVELQEIAHVRRGSARELADGVRHAVVTPLPGQLGHGREMPDDVLRKPRLPKAFAPRREWDVAISDGPAERLGKDARIVVQIGRFRPRQIVDLSDMRCGVVEDRRYRTRHVNRRDRRGLAAAHRQRQLVGGPHAGGGE